MDDGETAPPAAKRRNRKEKKSKHIPHELVVLILAHLPVLSLIRFSCVCKAWLSTIRKASFRRAHLRQQKQKPCLLISPRTLRYMYSNNKHKDKIGLYRLEDSQESTAAALLHATDISSDEPMHRFAHCDGLVLLPGESTVLVLNPATRRTLTLPWSSGADPPSLGHRVVLPKHQAFGLGHDARSDMYKVARFFYLSLHRSEGGGYNYAIRMEVFTVGADRHWRQTAEHPPYPLLTDQRQPAAFFKGNLVWTVDERILGHASPGFLCLSLEDESFGVMPAPPCFPMPDFTKTVLTVLRGDLCLALEGSDPDTIEMWMCCDIENPQWEQRYTINVLMHKPPDLNPIAIFDDEIVFKEWYRDIRRYDLKTEAYKEAITIENLRYHNPTTGRLAYKNRSFSHFDVIPYVQSLIPV